MCSRHDDRNSLTGMYTYLDSQNSQQGPFSLNQLFSWCAAGQMPPTTMVRLHKPNETFRALLDVPGFSTWVRPFGQSWYSLAQHKQQRLPPPQLTPPQQRQWLLSPPLPPLPQKLVALAAAPATPATPATPTSPKEVGIATGSWRTDRRRNQRKRQRSALKSCGLDSQGSKKDQVVRMLQPEPAQSAKRKASELTRHDEEQMQGVQVAGLAEEVAGLRARLAKETQGRQRLVEKKRRFDDEVAGLRALLEEQTQARQRAESAQEEMRAAKRARLEQSDREANEVAGLRARLEEETQARQRAEVAQEEMRAAKRARLEQYDREAAAVAWRDAAGSAASMEMEVVDSDGFMARFLAFRQARSCHLHAQPAPSGTAPRASVRPPLTARPAPTPPRLRAVCRIHAGSAADQNG